MSTSLNGIWIVTVDGDLLLQTDLDYLHTSSFKTVKLEKTFDVNRVAAADGYGFSKYLSIILNSSLGLFSRFLFALSKEGQLFARLGISSVCKEGTHWVELLSAPKKLVLIE